MDSISIPDGCSRSTFTGAENNRDGGIVAGNQSGLPVATPPDFLTYDDAGNVTGVARRDEDWPSIVGSRLYVGHGHDGMALLEIPLPCGGKNAEVTFPLTVQASDVDVIVAQLVQLRDELATSGRN